MVSRYQKRISGPLLDRIDLFVEVPRVEYEKLVSESQGEGSEPARARVEKARARQRQRFRDTPLLSNSEMGPVEVREFCKVEPPASGLLQVAMDRFHLSARAFHRVLKLARTISDLAGSEALGPSHVAEALQYRPRTIQ